MTDKANKTGKPIRTALIGAGYIADWHVGAIAALPGVEITAICDRSARAADALAATTGARAFSDLDEMLAVGLCDAVHILTPPPSHLPITLACLAAGQHVLVEKPVALSGRDTARLVNAAKKAGCIFAAGHNFLGLPAYQRLKRQCGGGRFGRITSAEINWHFPLAPLRSGPFGLWLLAEPKNLLLELAPHLFAFAQDLFGPPEILCLETGKEITLPGGYKRPQSFRILARAGEVDLNFSLSLVETMDDRSLTLRGSTGMARLDYAHDTLLVSRENTADIVANPMLRQASLAAQSLREGSVNLLRQVSSLNRRSPYGISFQNTASAFYEAIHKDTPLDKRFNGVAALSVMRAIDEVIALMPDKGVETHVPPKPKRKPKPEVLVIGGTGFIGRSLTRALVAQGRDVRVLSRGRRIPFDDLVENVEAFVAALDDEVALARAMKGIRVVYHLAKSTDNTWEDALKNEVGVSEGIARAAIAAGVERFIYTGTIASYDMSDPKQVITEATGFAADMSDRNLYARAKAETENRLKTMARDQGLPLTIVRPGIVVGPGGPLQHWGIGRWHGAGAVRIWGGGHNILPFVLIDDLSDALIEMAQNEAVVGLSFNLTGEPMLSARDYFDAIHRELGAQIKVSPGWLTGFWLADGVKFALKKHALKRQGIARASLKDWQSRAHFSAFDNSHAKQVLGWQPETDKKAFIRAAITKANLFGF
jgi:predicted dehydrogenase/nucleoside-diphosphate-sugar epimerase